MESPVTVTSAAAERALSLIDAGHFLRFGVQGGGCGGLQYQFAPETEIGVDVSVFESEGVTLVIDNLSLPFVKGATLDYVDDLNVSGFKVDNPNAASSCGCGQSFLVDDDGCGAAAR